jgi:putative FmdB family regulatory protein
MPIYEYRCSSCGHEKEVLQKMSDAPLAECPACGKSTFRKLISAAGFQLKGSGWYATDFKGGAKPAAGDGKEKSGAKEDAKSKEASGSGQETKAREESKSKQESKGEAPASGGASAA